LTAQQTISGVIMDREEEEPLIGASIFVKGMDQIGTISGLDGSFSLEVSSEASILIFSYTGFQTKEIPAEECNNQIVYLPPTASTLNEVLVVGYGTQVRSDMTGSVSKIRNEYIEGTPVTSLESTLQGRAAGVFITNESGKLGYNIDVRIRGTASLSASVQPLYVVDGLVINSQDQVTFNNPRLNPLSDLNFNDIESIDILKDASAAAIYGSRASNGVIIITTKQGKEGDTQIDLDVSSGWSRPTRKRKWLNAAQYLELWDEAFANVADGNGELLGENGEQWKDRNLSGWRDGNDTNWENLMYNPDAGQKNVQLNVSGGNAKTRFFLSGGYTDQKAIIILNAYERLSSRMNLTHQANEKVDFGVNMSLSRSILEEVPTDTDFASPGGLIAQSPLQPLYDPDNPKEIFQKTVYFNAWSYVDNVDWETTNLRTLGNAFLNWRPFTNLNLHTDFGLDIFKEDGERYYNSKVALNTGEPNGLKRTALSEAINYSTNTYATYQIQKNERKLDLTLGMSFQELNESRLRVHGRNFPNDQFQNLSSAADIFLGIEDETAYSVLSYFGRLHFAAQGKYLFSFSSRIDGDSRFGKDNRYGFFPAGSVGWVVSKESFFPTNLISYLKLRGSWGLTGNTPLAHFPALGLFEGSRYGVSPAIVQTQIPNPNLRWEKTEQVDIGVDLGILEDRISGQIDYYVKQTDDLLLQVNIPATTGFATQLRNLGAMKNEGFEVSLNTTNFTGDFQWKTSFNFSRNINTVTDIQGQVIESGRSYSLVSRIMEGQSIGVFFAPEFAGVDPTDGDALYYLNTKLDNGMLDRETTNQISEAERVIIGDPNPEFIYGLSNSFAWKGLELNLLFQGVYGNDIYNGAGRFQMDGFGWFDNQDLRMLGRWQQPGDQTDIPQVRFRQGAFNSSRFIEKGSYLRLKNLSLGYQLPSQFIDSMGLRQMKIYFTGQNLLTFTKYRSGDPEVNSDIKSFLENGSAITGLNFFTPPQAKTFIFGVKAKF
jgi:TonB-linked SusC/RagA family outer membrane protein